jgi:hypothetical protein
MPKFDVTTEHVQPIYYTIFAKDKEQAMAAAEYAGEFGLSSLDDAIEGDGEIEIVEKFKGVVVCDSDLEQQVDNVHVTECHEV